MADTAAANASLLGMAVTAVIGFLGWIVSSRSQRTDSATALVDAALAISDRHLVDEHDCRERLDATNARLAATDRRLDAVVTDLADCHDRHARAEAAMEAAGISLTD